MELSEAFLRFAEQEKLLTRDDKILLAVSGGIDSMVMADLFLRNRIPFAIAHCNFQLRGDESEKDEDFIRQYASTHDITLYTHHFETEAYAAEKKISIQMAARELRFHWFEKLSVRHDYTKVALGHNQDDVTETFFINLCRGTGIRGLTSMDQNAGIYIRPLLFARRKHIEQYAKEWDIQYREDSSNASLKYTRNKIRHQILPNLENINPHFHDNLIRTINNLKQTESLYNHTLESARNQFLKQDKEMIKISIPELTNIGNIKVHLFETLRHYGFTTDQINEITASINKHAGKQFFSPTHRLIKDRDCLIVTSNTQTNQKAVYYIEQGETEIHHPLHLSIEVKKTKEYPDIIKSPDYAFLDYDKLNFPLILRKWRQGDYFMPLGLQGLKKLSDFFVDQKMSLLEKEQTWLLTSGEKIVWVVGKRIDERFKVSEETHRMLIIERKNHE